jgi:hypothetical protein
MEPGEEQAKRLDELDHLASRVKANHRHLATPTFPADRDLQKGNRKRPPGCGTGLR